MTGGHVIDGWTVAAVRAACADLPPPSQHRVIDLDRPRPAAILVPVVDDDGAAALVVTKRHRGMASHADDWVFPGGRMHEGDTSTADTARRETSEELGIALDAIEVIGQLDTHGPIISGYVVEVHVGIVRAGTTLHPDPREVAELAVIRVADLLHPDRSFLAPMPAHDPGEVVIDPATIHRPGVLLRWYTVRDGEHLWGMQGNILHNLLHHLTGGAHALG